VPYPHLIVARLYEQIGPMDRGERYEDRLQSALEVADAGEVTGGGSLITDAGEIAYAELELALSDLNGAVQRTVEVLERAGAPQGSEIINGREVLREFGRQQCVAVYLDGVSLPDAVYASLDIDDVIARLGESAGPDSFRGHWQGPEETGLYFFAPDAEEAFARMEPVLAELPIGQNARVVIRHGKGSLQPRTHRMPRR